MALIYNATFDSGTRILSLLDKAGNVISSCEVPGKSNELTLTATADNSSVKLTMYGTVNNTYEVNTGSGWAPYTFDTVINLNKGQSCKWRCTSHPTSFSTSPNVRFVMTGTIEASGNCNSMLSSDFENLTSLSGYDYAFVSLFRNCTSLTKAPSLPATTLSKYCYEYMFWGCESLTQAPQLPATTLADGCYEYMFNICKSLTQAPALPATTLANSCYDHMFSVCKSLTQAPELPATTLRGYCYQYMFGSCSNLKEVRIAATSYATSDTAGALNCWLKDVSATGDFYCDPSATIFPTDSTSGIPANWTRRALADYPVTP